MQQILISVYPPVMSTFLPRDSMSIPCETHSNITRPKILQANISLGFYSDLSCHIISFVLSGPVAQCFSLTPCHPSHAVSVILFLLFYGSLCFNSFLFIIFILSYGFVLFLFYMRQLSTSWTVKSYSVLFYSNFLIFNMTRIGFFTLVVLLSLFFSSLFAVIRRKIRALIYLKI